MSNLHKRDFAKACILEQRRPQQKKTMEPGESGKVTEETQET